MSDAMTPAYGGRARMALVVPSPNTVAETEFWQMAPAGVTVHTSRMPFFPEKFSNPLGAMEEQATRVLEEAATAEPDIIAYGCTASSAVGNPDVYERDLVATTGRATVTAAAALVAAIRSFGVHRIALVTPYPPQVNQKEAKFFKENGIEVVVDESLIVDPAQQIMKNMRLVPPSMIIESACTMGARDDVDAIVLACCDMPTLEAIEPIEQRTGKPVASSTQALFWRALRTAGIEDSVPGCGRLLA
ncbi:MAG: hypothetical protein HOI95_27625 [Chromatiales bacterium]|nr:hypothetical protein [Chromatiales bacterium]